MPSTLASLLALASGASASTVFGMNYASTNGDGSARTASDFKSYFQTAASLAGTSGINSARLYTMIQGGTTADPIQAIQAAIDTNTSLLLGAWTSGDGFANEMTALNAAIKQYGSDLANLVVGISVGSEDLYRNSPMGIAAKSLVGAGPDTIVDCIKQVRSAIAGTALKDVKVGHVDTWTAWTNGSNSAVIDNCDWIGFDGYPFWQSTDDNTIENARSLFIESVQATQNAVGGKPVWITETGWPVSYNATSGAANTYGKALASVANAKTYWDEIACGLMNVTNAWWYILSETGASPDFSVSDSNTNPSPLWDLSCPSNVTSLFANSASSGNSTSNSTSTSSSSGSTGSSSSGSTSGSGSGTGTGTGTGSGSGSSSSSTHSTHSSASSNMASLGAMVLAIMAAVVAL